MGDRWLVGWLLVGVGIIVATGTMAAVALSAPEVISSRTDARDTVHDAGLADQSTLRTVSSVAVHAGGQIESLGRRHLSSTFEITDPAIRDLSSEGTATPVGPPVQPAADEQVTADRAVRGAAPIRHLWFERDGEPIVVEEPLGVGLDVEAATLRQGPGHYPSTALPGQPGNIGIAGHRTTFGSPFGTIDQLADNDTVHLLDEHGREWVYRFVASKVVDPDNVWVLADDALGSERDLVTLTTCHPRFSASRRLVVWAELVGDR